jgi:hypothetical protein
VSAFTRPIMGSQECGPEPRSSIDRIGGELPPRRAPMRRRANAQRAVATGDNAATGRIGVNARRVLFPVRRGGVTGVSKTALGALAVSPPSRSDPRREALL